MLLDDLLTSSPVLTDGAWGTQLQARGLSGGLCPDAWNLSHPDQVAEVPRAYIAAGSQIVLTAGSGGHFVTQGSINGRAVEFLVDTGATNVAMGQDVARRLGIDFEKGQLGRSSTANGVVNTYRIRLAKVRIQDVEVYDVEASVLPGSMPNILLGNSFLTRFQMKRENEQLTLSKRF